MKWTKLHWIYRESSGQFLKLGFLNYISGIRTVNEGVVAQQKNIFSENLSISSGSSRYSIEFFNSILESINQSALKPKTKKLYHTVWVSFNQFLLKFNRLPRSWEEKILLFVTHLADSGKKPSTIKSYVSAIKNKLKTDGTEIDDQRVELTAIIRAVKLKDNRIFVRLPINKRILAVILDQADVFFGNQVYLKRLYKAMLILGYFALLRVGEITSGDYPIKARDVRIGRNRPKLVLTIRESKTSSLGQTPHVLYIPTLSRRKEILMFGGFSGMCEEFYLRYCPWTLVKDYAEIRPSQDLGNLAEPFFVFRDKTPVKPEQLRVVLKTLLQMANLDHTLYSTHSLRIGRSCDLNRAGVELSELKRIGRWWSSAVENYIRA